ncbi:testis-expressed protein 2 [Hypomesus transpacificus]|uniref:testis-expressed protein 2 n=1 Tax=Hypomesus transpacificus TaxID=137520 RepID=UPI001F087B52|nr:testis-expressed protein 2 [Hypomesus transpacificus]
MPFHLCPSPVTSVPAPCPSTSVPAPCPSTSVPERGPSAGSKRDIVIQLTGTEGEWDSLDDSQLIFSLDPDQDQDYPSISLSRDYHLYQEEERTKVDRGHLHSPAFHVPLSPSSPGSLGECLSSSPAPSLLTPSPNPASSPRPLASLVKSLSTELELKEGSSLRPRPLISLVKSISTELSRSEPEVSQSRSDSRLNLHLWKQLTQPKGRSNGDSRTAPPSPSCLSPVETPKGGFFKMELEDTKRKLTEAMQEPLNMFTKIMKEESSGSPKHQRAQGSQGPPLAGSPISRGVYGAAGWDTGGGEVAVTEPLLKSSRSTDADSPTATDCPRSRFPRRSHHRTCSAHAKTSDRGEDLEICTYDDIIQVVAVDHRDPGRPRRWPQTLIPSGPSVRLTPPPPPVALPRMGLFCVAVLSYAYLTLPISSYLSGLALGLALGFLLGLLLIKLGSSRTSRTCGPPLPHKGLLTLGESTEADPFSTEPCVLKGWMNEVSEYDPETHHPCLSQSVWASVEGGCLSLSYPRTSIPRRAAYDERLPEASFTRTQFYQLAHCKVFLLPSPLARKRLWNPKYPICLQLGEGPTKEEAGAGMGAGVGAEEPPVEETEPRPASDLPATLYLFGRTGREKEEWFHRFSSASMVTQKETPGRCAVRSAVSVAGSASPPGDTPGSMGCSRLGSTEEEASLAPTIPTLPQTQTSRSIRGPPLLDYPSYMARLLAVEQPSPLASPGSTSPEASPTATAEEKCTCDLSDFPEAGQTEWVNALIGRMFWDFLREKYWADLVSHKIQKKLSKIRLPYFMNELTLTELDMGSCLPQVNRTSRPVVNQRGLWLELDVVYTGALQMTLQTKFNLSRLGREGREGGLDTDSLAETSSTGSRSVLATLADSDEESSSAGSSDEEELPLSEPQGIVGEKGTPLGAEGVAAGGGKTGRRLLKFVDKIAKSKYFQKATENEFIKKKIEEMSNTPLLLAVEVQELSGPLVVNIPPPPTDRIWYSFSEPPKLDLRVRPKLGEREVTFCHVTEWIERKLQEEFQKVFVLPNMDDICLPLMHSGMDSPPGYQCSPAPPSRRSSLDSIERIPPLHPTD